MQYLGGIPEIDQLIENNTIDTKVANVSMEMRPKGVEIYLMQVFSKTRIGLYNEKIKNPPSKKVVLICPHRGLFELC